MEIRNLLGAAFLLVGTVGAVLVFGAYDDLSVTYRADGVILCNGEPFFPVGVYYIPLPNQKTKEEIEALPRETFFAEFAALGGNFLCWPSFHFYWQGRPRWDNVFACDVTDNYPGPEPPPDDYLYDLQYAEEYGIKILPVGSLAYDWTELPPDYRGYYVRCLTVDYKGKTRGDVSRAAYFNTVVNNVVGSGADEAFFGWGNFHEGPWRPWLNREKENHRLTTWEEQQHVYEDLRAHEAAAGGNRPVVFEECIAAIIADLLRQYNAACDVLAYNVRIFPAPNWSYNWLNNSWASITGDTADLQYWSVDGAKPVVCCVDAVWYENHFPTYHQLRFMTYDAVIHRVNGLTWGAYPYVYPRSTQPGHNIPDEEVEGRLKPVIREVGTGVMPNVLKAAFDDTMVEAVVKKDGTVVERTAIMGGSLTPKSHLCSGRYLMEGCAKLVSEEIGPGTYVDFVYLIAACREGRDSISGEPVNEYDVTFKPYFSGSWFATSVEVIEPDGTPTQLPVVNGTFTDTFESEDVRIYKFRKPPRFGES